MSRKDDILAVADGISALLKGRLKQQRHELAMRLMIAHFYPIEG